MPRTARKKSETDTYHVMLRGTNQQQIFEDDEDREKFLEILDTCKAASGFELFAYCLMGNHVHLLMRTKNENLDKIFKRIGARYVYWYNWKYQRSGHLFQDRFRSEPINNDRSLLAVLRYIHQNPLKVKLCDTLKEYQWSSYHEYIGSSISNLVDTRLLLEMTELDEFIRFNNTTNSDVFLENTTMSFRYSDAEVKELMRKICDRDTVEAFLELSSNVRDASIKKLYAAGVSIRHMSRLTGVSKGIIERILR